MGWKNLTFATTHQLAKVLEDELIELGASAVAISEGDDARPQFELEPGQLPEWETVGVAALLPETVNTDTLISQLRTDYPELVDASMQLAPLPEQDWERSWMERFEPMDFGNRLWICPSNHSPPDSGATNIMLDPGLAFGTGTHETTSLCMEWLGEHDMAGKLILDYGCGSGILAIAALMRGADHAIGVDIDPRALDASQDNARRNHVADRLSTAMHGELPADTKVDVLFANILANTLIELRPLLLTHTKPGADIVLSGILRDQADEVISAYAPEVDLAARFKGDWALLYGIYRTNDT